MQIKISALISRGEASVIKEVLITSINNYIAMNIDVLDEMGDFSEERAMNKFKHLKEENQDLYQKKVDEARNKHSVANKVLEAIPELTLYW